MRSSSASQSACVMTTSPRLASTVSGAFAARAGAHARKASAERRERALGKTAASIMRTPRQSYVSRSFGAEWGRHIKTKPRDAGLRSDEARSASDYVPGGFSQLMTMLHEPEAHVSVTPSEERFLRFR